MAGLSADAYYSRLEGSVTERSISRSLDVRQPNKEESSGRRLIESGRYVAENFHTAALRPLISLSHFPLVSHEQMIALRTGDRQSSILPRPNEINNMKQTHNDFTDRFLDIDASGNDCEELNGKIRHRRLGSALPDGVMEGYGCVTERQWNESVRLSSGAARQKFADSEEENKIDVITLSGHESTEASLTSPDSVTNRPGVMQGTCVSPELLDNMTDYNQTNREDLEMTQNGIRLVKTSSTCDTSSFIDKMAETSNRIPTNLFRKNENEICSGLFCYKSQAKHSLLSRTHHWSNFCYRNKFRYSRNLYSLKLETTRSEMEEMKITQTARSNFLKSFRPFEEYMGKIIPQSEYQINLIQDEKVTSINSFEQNHRLKSHELRSGHLEIAKTKGGYDIDSILKAPTHSPTEPTRSGENLLKTKNSKLHNQKNIIFRPYLDADTKYESGKEHTTGVMSEKMTHQESEACPRNQPSAQPFTASNAQLFEFFQIAKSWKNQASPESRPRLCDMTEITSKDSHNVYNLGNGNSFMEPFPINHPEKMHPSVWGSQKPANSNLTSFVGSSGRPSRSYKKSSNLMSHTVTSSSRRYPCDICGRAFSRSNTLITHRRIHTGEKPFRCPVCGRSFRQPGNLTRHRLTHTTIKPYSCHLCCRAFNRASNLQTHIRTHQ